jgi:hypothetical protein
MIPNRGTTFSSSAVAFCNNHRVLEAGSIACGNPGPKKSVVPSQVAVLPDEPTEEEPLDEYPLGRADDLLDLLVVQADRADRLGRRHGRRRRDQHVHRERL